MYTRFYRCLKREDNFIAGHSMGGYGTIKFALTQSQLFSKMLLYLFAFDVSMLKNTNGMIFHQSL